MTDAGPRHPASGAPAGARQATPAVSAAQGLSSAPLLFVVDDEEQICTLLTRTLARDGTRVRAFSSARAALAALPEDRPDVVVTDLMMPEMPGLELARKAREILPEVAIVVITGYASLENVVDALRSHVDDFVTKPFGAQEIRGVVARALERRGRRTEPRTAEVAAAAVAVPGRFPENQAIARRLKDMALFEAVHGVLAEELPARDLLRRCRGTFEGALGATRALLLVPTGEDAAFTVAAATDGEGVGTTYGDLAFLRLVTVSGAPAPCGPAELGALIARLDTGPAAAASVRPRDAHGEDAGVLVLSRPAFGRRFEGDDLRVVGVVAQAIGDVWRSFRAAERAEEALLATLGDVTDASERRTPWFRDHGARVRAVALALADRVGLPEPDREVLDVAAPLLDVGRAALPDAILGLPGRPSPAQWAALRAHAADGAALIRLPGALRSVAEVVRAHHENWDGSGYPDGLRGEEIPPAAAVARIADAFVALTSPRPWREPYAPEAAVRRIVEHSGSQFRPQYVAAFAEMQFDGGAPAAPGDGRGPARRAP